MDTREIYIAYETDVWLSNNNRTTLYIGDYLADVIAQIGDLYSMNYHQQQEFLSKRQITIKGVGLIIEQYNLNCFV